MPNLTPYSTLANLLSPLVLTLAVLQAGMAVWPALRGWPETTATRSAALDTPLVPVAPTFAIWGPIFAGCLAFALWMAWPGNFHDPLAPQLGWIAAAVFAANALWEWVVPRRGLGWSSVILALVEWVGLGLLLLLLHWGRDALDGWRWWLVAVPFQLYAGWVTVALAVNLSSVLKAKGWRVGTGASLALLALVGGPALAAAWLTGAWPYALAIGWALGGVALAARRKGGRRVVGAVAIGLAMALLAATALGRPSDSPPPDVTRDLPPLQSVEANGLAIAYHEWGPTDGPVVLALHGWPDDATAWHGVATLLAAKGFRVLAPYTRGVGPTRFLNAETPRTGQLAALVLDAEAFLDALGVERFGLIGQDWGGRVAQGLAARHPERIERLVSLSGYSISYEVGGPPSLAVLPHLWYQAVLNLPLGRAVMDREPLPFAWRLWRHWSPSWDVENRAAAFASVRASLGNRDWVAVTLSAYSYTGRGHDPTLADLEGWLAAGPAVPVPVLVIQGAGDPLERPRGSEATDRERFTAGVAYVALPGVGHWAHREAPHEVARLYEEGSSR
jgi:pimeloyl-ACP methyl ester carboxylesterase